MRPVFTAMIAATLVLGPGVTWSQDKSPACTFEQMQVSAESVIAPCTTLIDDKSLTPEARAQAFFVRGRGYGRTRRTGLAAQDYDLAIKLDPTRSEFYVSRSNAEYRLGHANEGWADLNRALAVDPRNAQALRAMGTVYEGVADYDEAVRLYSRALEIDPTEPYALLSRSERSAAKHAFALALADASTLVAMPPAVINKLGYVDERGVLLDFHAVALNHRAELYRQVGDVALAKKDLDDALAYKRTPQTLRTRAEFRIREHTYEDALKDLDEAIALDGTDGTLHYDRGLALAGLQDWTRGLAAFDRAIELHTPANANRNQRGYDLRMRARMLRGLSRIDEAVETLEKAMATSETVVKETTMAMANEGFWPDTTVPAQLTPAYRDAIRACMIDKDCN